MAFARQKGEVETESACEHPSPHNATAIACVPNPTELGAEGLRLCEYHLALWNDINPDAIQKADVQHLVPDDAILHLEQTPETITRNGIELERLGIDHTGHPHYISITNTGEAAIIDELDEQLEPVEHYATHHNNAVEHWLQHVKQRRGWVLIDPNYRDHQEADSL